MGEIQMDKREGERLWVFLQKAAKSAMRWIGSRVEMANVPSEIELL